MDDQQKIRCNRCQVLLLVKKFKVKRSGEYMKNCIECNTKRKIYNDSKKCEHKRRKTTCKQCQGGSICEHDKIRAICKQCQGGSICEHDKTRTICKQCQGGSICEHDKIRTVCKQCQGGSICEHDKIRTVCKQCQGGSICEHDRRRSLCKQCKGGSVCDHGFIRPKCKECDPIGHLSGIVRSRVSSALKSNKSKHSIEYLGCTIGEFRQHIEDRFAPGMSWENYGEEWEIDHIVPIKYRENGKVPTIEEVTKRLHYLNTKPMWYGENQSKCNKYID